jgi:hypothetical protein
MNTKHQTLLPGSGIPSDHQTLRDEIQFLEQRLRTIGEAGDSAYEKLLIRAYTDLLSERRQLLDDCRNA